MKNKKVALKKDGKKEKLEGKEVNSLSAVLPNTI